jgi:argininosuccinate lyase
MAAWRRFAWDVSLFTTAEFGFVTLDASLTTGSSIMPQKRNPDIAELMRAASAVVQGAIAELMALSSLPSGYHRDGQLGKAPLFRALDETLATSDIVPRLCDGMTFHEERMRAAIDAGCFATDRAIELTAQGVPFRDAYRQVAAEIARLERGDASSPDLIIMSIVPSLDYIHCNTIHCRIHCSQSSALAAAMRGRHTA